MTGMPGSVAPTATAERRRVQRFSATERIAHGIHAAAFFALLITGLALYLPGLAGALGSRPALKALHLYVVAGWAVALLVLVALTNRAALSRTIRQLESFDSDDLRWLTGRGAPQGRFNAGQKVHSVLQAAFAVLFVVSGVLLLLGETNTRFRLSGTILLHDGLTVIATIMVAGHLYLAMVHPRTRPALPGIIRGTVAEDWARRHHAKWVPSAAANPPRAVGARSTTVSLALLGSALALAYLTFVVVPHSTRGSASARPGDRQTATAAPQAPDPSPQQVARRVASLAAQAVALARRGEIPLAVHAARAAVSAAPDRSDLRTLLGTLLAASGQSAQASEQLDRAIRLDPALAEAHLELGLLLAREGRVSAARREMERYLQLDPGGAGAPAARRLIRKAKSLHRRPTPFEHDSAR